MSVSHTQQVEVNSERTLDRLYCTRYSGLGIHYVHYLVPGTHMTPNVLPARKLSNKKAVQLCVTRQALVEKAVRLLFQETTVG